MSHSVSPSERPHVLVVDDEETIRDMLAEFLEMEGYRVETAANGMVALDLLTRDHFDLVLTDLKMPRMGGISLLEGMRRHAPSTLAVIMTGFGTVETAIDAMKRDAYDYVLKPFKLDDVLRVVARGIEKKRMQQENIRLKQALSLYRVSEAISSSLSLEEVMDTVVRSCQRELGADLVCTWLADGEGGWRERDRHVSDSMPPGERDIGEGVPAVVMGELADNKPLLVHGDAARRYFEDASTAPLASFLAVPLRVKSRTFGFIAAAALRQGRRFEEGQRKLATIIASRTPAEIENARL